MSHQLKSHVETHDATTSESQSSISSYQSQVKTEKRKDETTENISDVKTETISDGKPETILHAKSDTISERKTETMSEVKEDVDLDLTDPSLAKAALLFQSGFRGLQARLKFKSKVRICLIFSK